MTGYYAVAVACWIVAAGLFGWALGQHFAAPSEVSDDEEPDPDLLCMTFRVPVVTEVNGQPISAAAMQCVDYTVTRYVLQAAEELHDAAMARIYAQVAADEAGSTEHGIDIALARLQEGAA